MAIHADCTNPKKRDHRKILFLKEIFLFKYWHSHCTSTTKLVIP